MRSMMARLKLTVNETKTHVCRVPAETFDFLGYTFGRCYSPKTGRAYLGTWPMQKKVQKLCESISDQTSRRSLQLDVEEIVGRLNCRIARLGELLPPGSGQQSLSCRGSPRHATAPPVVVCEAQGVLAWDSTRFPDKYLYEELHLHPALVRTTRNFPWAKA